MNPSCDPAIYDDKAQSTCPSLGQTPQTLTPDMPPAYHMVVDPNAPIPNLHNPYDPEDEDEKEDDDTPEIIINAATQIRGNGNIVSLAQMDSARIASLLTATLNGEQPTGITSPPSTPRARERSPRYLTKMNITVNCGVTIIGDRNIVGPGLGDIARQVQLAQRNQAVAAQQHCQNQAQASTSAQTRTPPPSRCLSVPSEVLGGGKRRADPDAGESVAKRQC